MNEDGQGRSSRRSPGSAYWLIARSQNGPMEVLIIRLSSGEKALPVFSFREEAEMFHELGALGRGWQVKGRGAGELISVLYGLCAGVGRVALDPLPESVADKTVGLMSSSRKRFVEGLLVCERRSRPKARVRRRIIP